MKLYDKVFVNPLTPEQEVALNEIADKVMEQMSDFTYHTQCGVDVVFSTTSNKKEDV